ncbi:MAG: type II toxin-antitoxin system RelE/ParE family toxin [Tagaea sp.]
MCVLYAEAASKDVAEILAYVGAENPKAAEGIDRAILQAIRTLARFPNIGRRGRFEGTREIRVPSLPYILIYETSDDDVTVLAVLHAARDIPNVLDARESEDEP